MRKLLVCLVCLIFFKSFSQNKNYSVFLIPDILKENANSVIMDQNLAISIESISMMKISKHRVVTVFNKNGLDDVRAFEFSNNGKLNATIFDQNGEQIRKFKKNDFKYRSVSDGYSILTDSKMLYLDFTPTQYPFTIEFDSEVETTNTSFIPSWFPIEDYAIGILKSKYSITYPDGLGFKFKEFNFAQTSIKKEIAKNTITYQLENVNPIRSEEFAVNYEHIVPYVLFSLENFQLEGVLGNCKSWDDFGKWMNASLLSGLDEVSDETAQKIKDLTANEADRIQKARLIYKYVQDKTRYVSIQLGIGGWKPMSAKDVDRLGYGDCKALSNYTKALLKVVGIESYYSIIYAGSNKKDISSEFVCMQGNHATLAIPHQNKFIFLECTSQDKPFGFEGDFTDDRMALVIKPEGTQMVRTGVYDEKSNIQEINAKYEISAIGGFDAEVEIISKGVRYNDKYTLDRVEKDKLVKYYNNFFNQIENLKMINYNFSNDKENVVFKESLRLKSDNLSKVIDKKMMFPLNVLNQKINIPYKYRVRTTDFEIERGSSDNDRVEVKLPESYRIEYFPENKEVKTKFGEYKCSYFKTEDPSIIRFERTFVLFQKRYNKSEYESFRSFLEQVARYDNSKIILTQKI